MGGHDAVRAKAREILVGDPDISFTMLVALLDADSELRLRARGISVSKSTLQRRLAADPLYVRLQRGRRLARRRTRFVARAPHDIWHLDAKGPITISLRTRKQLVFHILTVLDDASRVTLASLVALAPDLCAAVRVFRLAAERWGLCGRIYADRASIFDSHAFRAGLADLGAHRFWVKPRNPEANGKIEAFIARWSCGSSAGSAAGSAASASTACSRRSTISRRHWHLAAALALGRRPAADAV